MNILSPEILLFVALLIIMFALFVWQAYLRDRYKSPPEAKAWKLGIPIQSRQLSESLTNKLKRLHKPVKSSKSKNSTSKGRYVVSDGNHALIVATPVSKHRLLTVGYCDIASGQLQIRVGSVELLHALVRLLFTILVMPIIMTLFIAFGADFLNGINLYLYAIPLVALTVWQLVRFVMNEGDVIEQFLHERLGVKNLREGQ